MHLRSFLFFVCIFCMCHVVVSLHFSYSYAKIARNENGWCDRIAWNTIICLVWVIKYLKQPQMSKSSFCCFTTFCAPKAIKDECNYMRCDAPRYYSWYWDEPTTIQMFHVRCNCNILCNNRFFFSLHWFVMWRMQFEKVTAIMPWSSVNNNQFYFRKIANKIRTIMF